MSVVPSKRKLVVEIEERRTRALRSCQIVAQSYSSSNSSDAHAIAHYEQRLQAKYDELTTNALINRETEASSLGEDSASEDQDGRTEGRATESEAFGTPSSESDSDDRSYPLSSGPDSEDDRCDVETGNESAANASVPAESRPAFASSEIQSNCSIKSSDPSVQLDESEGDESSVRRPVGQELELSQEGRNSASASDPDHHTASGDDEEDMSVLGTDDDDEEESSARRPVCQELEVAHRDMTSAFESDEGQEAPLAAAAPSETAFPDQYSDDASSDTDEDDDISVLDADVEIKKIQSSKLSIALQGLRTKRRLLEPEDDEPSQSNPRRSQVPGAAMHDRDSVAFRGKEFHKGRCYRYAEKVGNKDLDVIVGIRRFLSETTAEAVLVIPFEDTILGMTDDATLIEASSFQPATHVRVQDAVIEAPLECLVSEYCQLQTIPDLVYEPQTPGSWQQFAYYRDGVKRRKGRRRDFRLLDFFAGCGGMSLGFDNCNFQLVKAVEMNTTAIETFTSNHQNAPVYIGDINAFLARSAKDPDYRQKHSAGHLHTSPPCQGLSGANRTGGKNDKANNDLSLTIVDGVRIFQPVTASYENVLGLWKRKNIHYLKTIAVELMKMDYQVRCACLYACDYGDPQKRPRLFLFAAKSFALLPSLPPKTHGPKSHQLPFVTAKDALGGFEGKFEESATQFKDDDVKLKPNVPAPAVRGSIPPVHYSENRRITVEEAAALQSFPPAFSVAGTLTEQRKQIGNAVPVELATAVARSIRASLVYRYAEEDAYEEEAS